MPPVCFSVWPLLASSHLQIRTTAGGPVHFLHCRLPFIFSCTLPAFSPSSPLQVLHACKPVPCSIVRLVVTFFSRPFPAVVTEDVSSYLSLSAYSAKFSAQLAPPVSAVVVKVVEAPALEVEVPALDVEVVAVAEPAP